MILSTVFVVGLHPRCWRSSGGLATEFTSNFNQTSGGDGPGLPERCRWFRKRRVFNTNGFTLAPLARVTPLTCFAPIHHAS